MPAAESGNFVSQTTAKLLERLAYQVNTTLRAHRAEPVHDLRVAIRRFQQALATFDSAFPRHECKALDRQLKRLFDAAGNVRDCDVVAKLLGKRDLPGSAELKKKLQEHRKTAVPLLVSNLERWVARRSSAKWRAALLSCPSADDTVHPHLRRSARGFLKHAEGAVHGSASARDLHRLRIEAKKFRYMLELFEPAWGAPVAQWLERVKPVQSLLGDIHDAYMARDMAEGFGATVEVQAWLKRRQHRKSRQFARLWAEKFPAVDHALLLEALRRPPRKPAAPQPVRSVAAPQTA